MTSPNKRPGCDGGGGFTLTELLLVLLIIALLAGIVTPLLPRPAGTTRDYAAASEVVALLRHAREAARRSGRPHYVRLANEGEVCLAAMFVLDDYGVERAATNGYSPVRAPAVTAFGAGGAGDLTDPVIAFGPTGPDGAYRIDLDAGAGKVMRIEITSPSGLIRLATVGDDAPAADTEAIADYWEARCRHAVE